MTPRIVARATSERGEIVLLRRDDTLELRVNGVFVMDTAHTVTERLLARATLDQATRASRVLVGGLGLGYTTRELLADDRVEHVVVAEIEPVVLRWMRDGLLPGRDVLDDARVETRVGDIRRVVRDSATGTFDVILLDVDNGPDFLVHDSNAAVYAPPFLAECRSRLNVGGAIAVWSSTYSAALAAAMREEYGDCTAREVPVDLQGRDEHYWLFISAVTSAHD
ncbi:MAG: hypothetical protein ACRDOJ_14440 [Nocardioidaceae bacterium]